MYLSIVTGSVIRFLLYQFAPALSTYLDAHVEYTTPFSSFKRLQEGVFLFQHQIDPYDGDLFHQSPLLLALFSSIANETARNVLYTACEALTAYFLARIAASSKTSLKPSVVAATYLFNPFTLASSLAKSTLVLANCAAAGAIAAAYHKRLGQSALLFAVASVISFYYSIWTGGLISLILYGGSDSIEADKNAKGSQRASAFKFVLLYLVSGFILIGLSWATCRSDSFLNSVYGSEFLFKDITPNLGMWWYFFTEMFDYFRPFFVGIFQLFLFIMAAPISFRLRKYPLFAIATLQGLVAVFKPYPETGDLGLYITLLTLYGPQWPVLRYKLVVALCFAYVSILAPTFYHLWISLGSGNSNFFYAITLVHSLSIILAINDSVWAVLRIEFDGAKEPASQI